MAGHHGGGGQAAGNFMGEIGAAQYARSGAGMSGGQDFER